MHANTSPIQLIALDLDGTLLNAKKELTPVCRQALESAADAGILIVPATGRFFDAMPEAVRALPFCDTPSRSMARRRLIFSGRDRFIARKFRAGKPLKSCPILTRFR